MHPLSSALFFFFNDTATTEIYTLSLHDALPILGLVEIAPVLLLLDAGVVGHDLADLVLRHAVVDHFLVILVGEGPAPLDLDRKSTRLNSSHLVISYAVFCLKKKKAKHMRVAATA